MTTTRSSPGRRVCAVGEFTSKLAVAYLDHLATETPGQTVEYKLKSALEAVDLHVTGHQVSNLVKAIHEHNVERGSDSGGVAGGVSWGEFCAVSIDIYSSNHICRLDAPPRRSHTPHSKSTDGCRHDVFLGGSCNPTTWRRDVVIPYLHQAGLTYFNPQVEEWFPELIEIEEQAKCAASLLLFVVDSQTRAISSMVEVGYLIGYGRELVCYVEDLEAGDVIRGDALSPREQQDLNRGRLFVRNLLEEAHASLLVDDLTQALQVMQKIIHSRSTVDVYRSTRREVRLHPSLGEEIHLLHRVFRMYDNDNKNHLSVNELDLALRSLRIDSYNLQQLLKGGHHLGSDSQTDDTDGILLQYRRNGLTFGEFMCVYAELKYRHLASHMWVSLSSLITAPFRWIAGWLWPSGSSTGPVPAGAYLDVFLNGSCGGTTWRTGTSIPILKQYGVSFFNPQVANWDRRLLPIEREAKERCCVLLYVITGDTLAVGSLVEAAYYIGKGRSLVLCITDILCPSDSVTIEGMKLSAAAVKDYNRGRSYLVAMANKNRVPVYNDVAAATMATVNLALCMRGVKGQSQHVASISSSV